MKKVSIIVGVTVLSAMVAYYLLLPKAIVEHPESLDIYRVMSYSDSEGTEITESVDLNELAEVLSHYQSRRIRKSFAPYLLSEIRYEINGTYKSDSLHILVGDLNIVYGGRKNGGFEIMNSQKLLEEIDALVHP